MNSTQFSWLSSRFMAWVMLAAFFGFGSAKLRGKYNTARQWFTAGVAADNGYNLSEELTTRELSLIHI